MKRQRVLLAFLCSAVVVSVGCGGSSRQLQSLSITPASATAQNNQAQFTATAKFDRMPTTVTPAAVGWFQSFPVFDPPGGDTTSYALTSAPFTAQCFPGVANITVVAFAPVDANAKPTGSMPMQVFLDLAVRRNTTQEGGFMAATAQLTCP